jgi:hydrogenase expression/formation protein HypC
LCLAVPAKVLQVTGDVARVDFGQGVTHDVDITLVETQVGGYVLVHAGYAIEAVNEEVAEETLRLWEEILKHG